MGDLKIEHRFNYVSHLLFPARSYLKELIYWPTELAAALLVLIFIFQMDLEEVTLYNSPTDGKVTANRIRRSARGTTGNKFSTYIWGISYMTPNNVFAIEELDTDLLNYEYGWICFCYAIKHALYLVDFSYLYRLKRVSKWDFATPLSNFCLWTMWGLYAWSLQNYEVHAGMYLRYLKDTLYTSAEASGTSNMEGADKLYDQIYQEYQRYRSWHWLYIPTAGFFALNLALWVWGLVKKRSSAYTGQALSTLMIPMQLFFLHLFLKGSWIKSNYATYYYDLTTKERAEYSRLSDYFEARWVFWVIYLAAYAGTLAGVACLIKSIFSFKRKQHLAGAKYVCYAIFWGSSFIWTLFMDATLYSYFINWKTGLIVTQIICMATAVAIFVISVFEKKREGNEFYFRHDKFSEWWSLSDEEYTAIPQSNVESKPLAGEGAVSASPSAISLQPRPYKR